MERLSETEWREVIEGYKGSGLSISAYCRERGLNDNRFHYWRGKLGLREGKPKFVQVSGKEPLEVELSSGVTLRIPSGVNPNTLKQIIEALKC